VIHRVLALALAASCAPRSAAAAEGPYATEWLTAETGPVNRINLVVLGDGYTGDEASQAKLSSDARALLGGILGTSPYAELASLFTAKLVHVVSDESGATNGSAGGTRDTELGAFFGCAGIERLLCVDTAKALRIAAEHFPEYTWAIVVVNDPKYGGSGGTIAVTSTDFHAQLVVVHELGHTAGMLADEYDVGGGPPCPETDCAEPNVTARTERSQVKWLPWIPASTPVPTPPMHGYTGVGLFEGARYLTQGIFRPTESGCLMRALGTSHCDVCREALVWAVLEMIDLADSSAPAGSSAASSACQQATFSIEPVPGLCDDVVVSWTLDGLGLGEGGASVTLAPGSVPVGTHTVRAEARYVTPMALRDPREAQVYSRTWSLSVAECPILLSPAGSSVPPRGSVSFTVLGGGGPYSWAIERNPSGGSITISGEYTAGDHGGVTDVVRVADGAGNGVTAQIAVTAGVGVAPRSATVPPRARRTFSASGGDGVYTWVLARNASGGFITPAGVYAAGPILGASDVVRVADSLGNSATATVRVVAEPRDGPGCSSAGASGLGWLAAALVPWRRLRRRW
jgi:hypothetical protein